MATTVGNTEQVVMGAGRWYLKPYAAGDELNLEELCVEANLLGYTQGGATVTYTPTTYTIEDDIGMVKRTFMTTANARMKTGLLTFDIESLAALLSVGQLTQNTEGNKTVLKLGGGRAELKRFMVAFEYEKDAEKGLYIRVGMIATNTAAMEFAFTKEKETVPDIEFTGGTNGKDDVILTFEEDIAPAA
jgi:hypothetical protein